MSPETKKRGRPHGTGKSGLDAKRKLIEASLEKGISIRDIWRLLDGKTSYNNLRKYIRKREKLDAARSTGVRKRRSVNP